MRRGGKVEGTFNVELVPSDTEYAAPSASPTKMLLLPLQRSISQHHGYL